LDFRTYQKKAHETAIYPTDITLNEWHDQISQHQEKISWIYPALGLSGEVGETLNKLKKVIRDQKGELHLVGSEYGEKIDLTTIEDELGDIQWYVAELATSLGLNLDVIADNNIRKLAKRKVENKIHGSGDKR
jgi:NTP pyrophosphatase (non-canonical NTP hydrolase)